MKKTLMTLGLGLMMATATSATTRACSSWSMVRM